MQRLDVREGLATLCSFGQVGIARFGSEIQPCGLCGAPVATGVFVTLPDDAETSILVDTGQTFDLDVERRGVVGVHGCSRR
jgi:hypothetical protein